MGHSMLNVIVFGKFYWSMHIFIRKNFPDWGCDNAELHGGFEVRLIEARKYFVGAVCLELSIKILAFFTVISCFGVGWASLTTCIIVCGVENCYSVLTFFEDIYPINFIVVNKYESIFGGIGFDCLMVDLKGVNVLGFKVNGERDKICLI
jgi:hypothetical protein